MFYVHHKAGIIPCADKSHITGRSIASRAIDRSQAFRQFLLCRSFEPNASSKPNSKDLPLKGTSNV